MLDRSWVMSARIADTVQAHHNVRPTKRFAPDANDIRLGGAGATANAIAWDKSLKVHLLASFNPIDTASFKKLGLRPNSRRLAPQSIAFHSAHMSSPQTIVKFRVYERNPSGPPRLRFRFDQDPIAPGNAAVAPVLPPSLEGRRFDALVIADQNKGTISPVLIEKLCQQFRQSEWFIDTKNATLLGSKTDPACPLAGVKGTLLLNRPEFLRFRQSFCELDNNITDHGLFDGDGGRKLLLVMMKQVIKALKDSGFSDWRLVVKLDRDGAAAAWSTQYILAQPKYVIHDAAGICAGDFFLAGWLRKALDRSKRKISDRIYYECCMKEAIKTATAWLRMSEQTFWISKPHLTQQTDIADANDLSQDDINNEKIAINAGIIDTEIDRLGEHLAYPSILTNAHSPSPALDLSKARLYLEDFLTINPRFGRDIRTFVERVAEHLRHGERRRPLNCVIWAPPGSGKSFLAGQMEGELRRKKLNVVFREINVSSYNSRREVIEALAQASEEHTRGSLILIDELSSPLDGGNQFDIVPALLGPLWDGKVVWSGRSRRFD